MIHSSIIHDLLYIIHALGLVGHLVKLVNIMHYALIQKKRIIFSHSPDFQVIQMPDFEISKFSYDERVKKMSKK